MLEKIRSAGTYESGKYTVGFIGYCILLIITFLLMPRLPDRHEVWPLWAHICLGIECGLLGLGSLALMAWIIIRRNVRKLFALRQALVTLMVAVITLFMGGPRGPELSVAFFVVGGGLLALQVMLSRERASKPAPAND